MKEYRTADFRVTIVEETRQHEMVPERYEGAGSRPSSPARRLLPVIATHSPILMAYPNARIYRLGASGIEQVAYEETEHYRITRDFLSSPERFFKTLFGRSRTDVVDD